MEEHQTEFARLAAVVQDKRQHYQFWSMQNTFGLTSEELAGQEAAFVRARAEMWKAEADLQNATLRAVFGDQPQGLALRHDPV